MGKIFIIEMNLTQSNVTGMKFVPFNMNLETAFLGMMLSPQKQSSFVLKLYRKNKVKLDLLITKMVYLFG